MTWFRRNRDAPPAEPTAEPDDDSPDRLRLRLTQLVATINRNAGRLPVDAVVAAREVTDTVRAVIDTATDQTLDIHAVVAVNGIVGDYLPTTLQAYLNLDPSLTDRPGPSGRTPRAALLEQLDNLNTAADDLLVASRAHDADAVFSQGAFLRTKFTRSDLDL